MHAAGRRRAAKRMLQAPSPAPAAPHPRGPPSSRLAQELGLPEVSIVVQRQTMVGNTRFEDAMRLPLGLPINPNSFVGKVLCQVRPCSLGTCCSCCCCSRCCCIREPIQGARAGPGVGAAALGSRKRVAQVQALHTSPALPSIQMDQGLLPLP